MKNLINRQDAIDAIFGRRHEIIKMRIGNLPSAESEQRWIPCSEKLPNNHERVLLSVDPTYTGDGWVDIAYMCYGVKSAEYYFENNTKAYAVDEVLAWMPLPDAYEEDD